MKKRSRPLNRFVTGLVLVAALSLGTAGAFRWWRSLDPARTISGQVIDKTVVAFQGKRSRVLYQLTIDAGGRHERITISEEMYRAVNKGWRLEQHGSYAVATAPDGKVTARSVVY